MYYRFNYIFTSLIFIFIFSVSNAQNFKRPKKIKSKENYKHIYSNFDFPMNFGDFKRNRIYSLDKSNKNIELIYFLDKLSVSISIYPAPEAVEGRLRNEYKRSLDNILQFEDLPLHITQRAIMHKSEGYKCIGISAKSNLETVTQLTLFECGEWFYKLQIYYSDTDSLLAMQIQNKFIERWNPIELVKKSNLDSKASITINPTSAKDSLMLCTSLGSAFKKIEWVYENTDSLERAAGFPDMHLDMHVTAFKELVEFKKRQESWDATPETLQYINTSEKIIKSGFSIEYILESFGYLLLIPENLYVDIEKYKAWKKSNNIDLSIYDIRPYIISFKTE